MANMACMIAVLMYVLQLGMLFACWDADCLCCRCFNITMRSRMCADADVCVVQSEA